MLSNVLKTITLSVLIGSFIFLVSLMIISPSSLSKEILSVWVASALIGVASCAHLTRMSSILAGLLQLVVGAVAFSIVAVMNGWISPTVTDIFFYAVSIIAIIMIIQGIFILISVRDSKAINKKLNSK